MKYGLSVKEFEKGCHRAVQMSVSAEEAARGLRLASKAAIRSMLSFNEAAKKFKD